MSVIFQPYDWKERDEENNFVIRIWGHSKDSERVCVRIEDYQPFCRVQLPAWKRDPDDNRMKKIIWTAPDLKLYIQWLIKVLDDHAPVAANYEPLQNLYIYKSSKSSLSPYLTLRFSSEAALRHCTSLLNKKAYFIPQLGLINARVWEGKVSLTHRFVTERNLDYSAWLKATGYKVDPADRISNCEEEYLISWKDIEVVPKSESNGWSANPLIMSFDIECYSHNQKSFPNKMIVEDQITMISYVVKRLYDKEYIKGVVISKGCDEIPGAEVIVCKNELELLVRFTQIIKQYDPTILTGYNIFRFDLSYIKQRFNHYLMDDLPNCSCLLNGKTTIYEKDWESSGTGKVSIATLEAEGRITVDVYTIIRRDYKLDRYTLEHTYKFFMKKDKAKDDVTAKEMFQIFGRLLSALKKNDADKIKEAKTENTRVAKYAITDSLLPLDLFLELNIYVALIESSCIMKVPLMTIFTGGQQIRMQNQLFQYAYKKGFVLDERNIDRGNYKGGFVVDPIVGQYSNIITLDFASLYPSIIRAYNICYTTLIDDQMELPDSDYHLFEWEENDRKIRIRFVKKEILEGILPRMCEDLVNERNIVRKQIKPDTESGLKTILNQRQLALKVSANSIYGALGVDKGRLPLIEGAMTVTYVGRLLNELCRKYVHEHTTGKVVYGDTDSIMVDMKINDPYLCDKFGQELSEKITALFPSPLKLEYERAFGKVTFLAKKYYGGVELFSVEKNGENSQVISCELSPWIPFYENPEENLYRIVWLDKKKKKTNTTYITLHKEANIESYEYITGCPVQAGGKYDESVMIKKGIASARRDRCLWVRETYLEVFTQIIFKRSLEDCCRYLDHKIVDFMCRNVELRKLIATAEVGTYKETCHHPMKLFKEEMKRKGKPLQVGERIDFLVVKCEDPTLVKKGYKMRTFLDFLENAEKEPFDYNYCIERSLGLIITKLFATLFGKSEANRSSRISTKASSDFMKNWLKLLKQKEKYLAELKQRYWSTISCSSHLDIDFFYENLELIDIELLARYGSLDIIKACPQILWSVDLLSANPNLTREYLVQNRDLAWSIPHLVRNSSIGSEFLLTHGFIK